METNKDFQKILDTFSAVDGGISFVYLKVLVEQEPDNPIVLKVLKDMANLIKAAEALSE